MFYSAGVSLELPFLLIMDRREARGGNSANERGILSAALASEGAREVGTTEATSYHDHKCNEDDDDYNHSHQNTNNRTNRNHHSAAVLPKSNVNKKRQKMTLSSVAARKQQPGSENTNNNGIMLSTAGLLPQKYTKSNAAMRTAASKGPSESISALIPIHAPRLRSAHTIAPSGASSSSNGSNNSNAGEKQIQT